MTSYSNRKECRYSIGLLSLLIFCIYFVNFLKAPAKMSVGNHSKKYFCNNTLKVKFCGNIRRMFVCINYTALLYHAGCQFLVSKGGKRETRRLLIPGKISMMRHVFPRSEFFLMQHHFLKNFVYFIHIHCGFANYPLINFKWNFLAIFFFILKLMNLNFINI